jgi:hypothetical protein
MSYEEHYARHYKEHLVNTVASLNEGGIAVATTNTETNFERLVPFKGTLVCMNNSHFVQFNEPFNGLLDFDPDPDPHYDPLAPGRECLGRIFAALLRSMTTHARARALARLAAKESIDRPIGVIHSNWPAGWQGSIGACYENLESVVRIGRHVYAVTDIDAGLTLDRPLEAPLYHGEEVFTGLAGAQAVSRITAGSAGITILSEPWWEPKDQRTKMVRASAGGLHVKVSSTSPLEMRRGKVMRAYKTVVDTLCGIVINPELCTPLSS